MDVAMEAESQNTLTSCPSSLNDSSSSSSDVLNQENPLESLSHHPPIPGTVIPNRIFVGGIDHRVNEGDLHQIFSQYGAVKDVKIIIDRSGISKRYGFVTFENQDDVLRILSNATEICFKEKKLCIGQAVKKNHSSGKAKNARMANLDPQMSCGTFYLTTSTGHPYTYHKGVAYFHCPSMNPLAHHWSPHPQLMLPQSHQPVHPQQPPVYPHYQDITNQYQWSIAQVPTPFSAAMYSQQPEYPYQPLDGSSYLPPGPAMEGNTPEFLESTAPHFYSGMTPIALQHDPRESQLFPRPRVHLKPRHRRYTHPKDYYHLPEPAESPDAAAFPFHAPRVG
ncbi:protein boule-like [Poeciliopsis prolifica]|uniref:protein boule-like n=1 Tax=Poeciliopsis prolifica TaxID=188132 RepID=UPI002413D43D|nr:protein boule-like [Poeciliopsis prolifica]